MKKEFYVSLDGSDDNPGTKAAPFATLNKARLAVRRSDKTEFTGITVYVREGTYYLDQTLSLTAEDSGMETCPVLYRPYGSERVTLSGGRRLDCRWRPSGAADGVFECTVERSTGAPEDFDQLFVDGKRQILARFPNIEDGYLLPESEMRDCPADGTESDDDISFPGEPPKGIVFKAGSFDKEWAKPREAMIHIFQAMYWGNLQFRIQGVDYQNRTIRFGEGGTQIGAKWHSDPCRVDENSKYYIENVFEELDSPGEWYFDRGDGTLYFIPPEGTDIHSAEIVAPVLKTIVEIRGSAERPVTNVSFTGFRFMHTRRTIFDVYDIPSLGDWAIHRGGAVFLEYTRNCSVRESFFDGRRRERRIHQRL